MRSFELFGYSRVWLPTFEYASVLERTPSGVGGALRFVEPESGEVVALRADMTPQIARVVSTRFRNAPLPARLCYQGSVLRRRRERARTESQVVQAGIELVGYGGLEADFEVLAALCAAVRAAGLTEFVLNLGHAGIAAALLRQVNDADRPALNEALSAKDTLVVEHRGRSAGLGKVELSALVGLTELHGGPEVFTAAGALLQGTSAQAYGRQLQQLGQRVLEQELAPRLVVDFGETSRLDYYTGPLFQVLALGPGEPLASGGRYDNLYPRYGVEREAAGCALDINNVCWALERAGWKEPSFTRLAVAAGTSWELLKALRERQIACAVTPSDLASYAATWDCDYWLSAGTEPKLVARAGTTLSLQRGSAAQQAEQIAKVLCDKPAQ